MVTNTLAYYGATKSFIVQAPDAEVAEIEETKSHYHILKYDWLLKKLKCCKVIGYQLPQ
jgi:hypothetical protein